MKDPNTALIPAGTYAVGDPCYAKVFQNNHEAWLDFIRKAGYFNNRAVSSFIHPTTSKETPGWAWSTAYGDGTYTDVQGREYSVDSGLLGIIPLYEGDEVSDLMHVVEMPKGGFAEYNSEDMTLHIRVYGGELIDIPTGFEDDEDDDEDNLYNAYEDEDEEYV